VDGEEHVGINTAQRYLALKRKRTLTHSTAWKKLDDIMPNEINQSQKINAM
jgi:hypothetical protein